MASVIVASAVVETLVQKLCSPLWEQFGSFCNFTDDLEDMKGTLLTLNAVVRDAERRSGRSEGAAERLWLKQLKSAAYDVDDLLSGYEDDILVKKQKVGGRMFQKARMFFSTSNPAISRFVMALRVKGMRRRLNEIAAEHDRFHRNVDLGSIQQEEIDCRETTSLVDKNHENTIIGREEEKEELMGKLLDTEAEQVTIIPIVGLGGIGKTTLAKLLFNDERVNTVFNLKAWVYVSTKFDLKKIGEAVVESLDGCSKTFITKDVVCNEVRKKLEDKRFFIVLDDVWEEDGQKLEELKLMLQSNARGSKIILTTRSKGVASMMCSNKPHYLKVLSNEDCWILFSQRAFKSEAEKTNEKLIEIGWGIVEKCQGVPLAAIALGFTMRSKEGLDAWCTVRDNQIWEFEQESGSSSENKILTSLRLSYYNMPAHLKLCFTYCSIFPNGHRIDKNKLILEWIALGFIPQKGRSKLEQIGEGYINHLTWFSFLQHDNYYFVDKGPKYRMHDLVHDLARSIADDEVLFLDNKELSNFDAPYCRYARVVNYNEPSRIYKLLPKNIRALYLVNGCISKASNCFNDLKGLRVLCLDDCHVESLPESVFKLKQLRYFRVEIRTKTLPKSIGQLNNLIALDLSDSFLEELPNCIGGLNKLQFLNLSSCENLSKLNDSVTELKNLEHLDLNSCIELEALPMSIGELHKLSSLNISRCVKLEELPESIGSIRSLENLDLSECKQLKDLPKSFTNLCNLRFLKLNHCNNLQKFPEPHNNLGNLQTLNLSYCKNLVELPYSFGKLVNLENLDIRGCYRLEDIPESLGELKKLRRLNLFGCGFCPLPEWISELTNLEFLKLPQRITLSSISQLVKLKKLKISNVESIEGHESALHSNNINIEHMNYLEGELHIFNLINVEKPEELDSKLLCHISNLQHLHLNWRDERYRMVQTEPTNNSGYIMPEKLRPHGKLKSLELANYPADKFPIWMMSIADFLPKLTQLKLDGLYSCNHLPPLGQLPNLLQLNIKNLHGIKKVDKTFAGGEQPFRSLKRLELRNLQNLEEWCTIISNEDEENVFMFPFLSNLCIIECTKLQFKPSLPDSINVKISTSDEIISSKQRMGSSSCKTLHVCIKKSCMPANKWQVLEYHSTLRTIEISSCEGLRKLPESIRALISLKTLEIRACDNLIELGENLKYLASLNTLEIWSCKNLVSLPHSLGDLTSLEYLRIEYCGKLEDLPESMQRLTTLRSLSMIGCRNVVCLPESLGGLFSLKKLRMIHCSKLESLPQSFIGLISLKELWIEDCAKLESLPQALGNLKSLEDLTIENCPKLKSLPQSLGGLTSLNELTIKDCPRLESLLESIQHLTSLTTLTIYGCETLARRCLGEDKHKISHIPYFRINEGGWYTDFIGERVSI